MLFVCISLVFIAWETVAIQRCPLKPAPVFSQDENLSYEGCGKVVKLPFDHYPWKAEIYAERYYCPGILISRRVVVTFDEETEGFNEPTDQISIYLGRCSEVDKDQPCADNNEGYRTKIERKVKLDVKSFDFFTFFFIIPKIPEFNDWVRPICLFNRDNSLDFSHTEVYRAYSGYSVHNYTAKILNYSDCFSNGKDKFMCDPDGSKLCVDKDGTYWTRGLVNLHNGRYYLRGLFSNITDRDNVCTFIDLLDHMDKFVNSAPDIFILQKPVEKKTLPEALQTNNLSFPGCGTKRSVFQRDLENIDDIAVEHIIRGQSTQLGNHPWHADISMPYSARCGGTLISPKAVITAAHCIHKLVGTDLNETTVTLGMSDTRKMNEAQIQKRNPTNIFIHPEYSAERLKNDIALLVFDKEFKITDFVRPACLWNEDLDYENIENSFGTVVGWGLDENLELPDELQAAKLHLVPHKECYFSKTSFFGTFLFPGMNFCAGYLNGTSTCNGDSGGGLLLKRGARWMIRGIVSAGRGHKTLTLPDGSRICEPNSYSLFTDVANYLDWIVENVPS